MISIIIIVKNDRKIDKTISSIYSNIDLPVDIEVIVVDSSGDKLNDIKTKYSQVKWIKYTNQKKKISIPNQRNVGIRNASSDLIVFIDAGCIPNKDWLKLLYTTYLNGENIVAGNVISDKVGVINNISRQYQSEIKYIEECPTANVLISKKVINEIGLFDEKFEYGSDTDFMWRAIESGFKIYYQPDAIVMHDWGDYKEQLNRSYRYGKGRMLVYLKHFYRFKRIVFVDPILVLYPIFIIFLPVAFFYPYYLLLIFIPLIKNINKKPLKTFIQNFLYGLGGLEMILLYTFKMLK